MTGPRLRRLIDHLHASTRRGGFTALATQGVIVPAINALAIPLLSTSTNEIGRLTSLIVTLMRPMGGNQDGRACVVCGDPIGRDDPFLRYRGDYYHAGSCIESDPPALRAHAQLTARSAPGG
jgi:hypothetical protein